MGGFDPEIMQDFLTESGELLEELEGDLVELESAPADPELLNKVFRALHTIKGSASFLDFKDLVEIAHSAENLLNAARAGDVSVDQRVMDLLLESVDLLKVQFGQIAEGDMNLSPAEPRLIADLHDATSGGPGTAAATTESGSEGLRTAPARGPFNASVRPLDLDSSKEDLLDFLVSDVEETLAEVQAKLDELADEERRARSAESIAELAAALERNADFFNYSTMRALTHALVSAGEAIADRGVEPSEQLSVRLKAICNLIGEQSKGLGRREMLDWPLDELIDRVGRLSTPGEDTDVPEAADPDEVISIDGIFNAADPLEPDAQGRATAQALQGPSAEPMPTPTPMPSPKAQAKAVPASNPDLTPAAFLTEQSASAGKKAENKKAEQTIRVEVGRLESLMNLVGELVLQKNRVAALARDIAGFDSLPQEKREEFNEAAGELDRTTGDIQVAVMRTRMQPLDKLFGRYSRLIRDLAGKTGKKIKLELIGGDTEVDKSVIEELGDPLVHLLRNSADHGLEGPEERAAAGKSPEGTITLAASHEGSHVRILIRDDGLGLSVDRIGAKAVERGMVTEGELATMSDKDIYRFIMLPGFSTADQVSDLSGRGVGMDVVRTNIEDLKGSIDVESKPGKGTTFIVQIPLTIAIMPAMMVAIGSETYAIPLDAVTEIVRPTAEHIGTIGEAPVLRLRDSVLPVLSGSDLFGMDKETAGKLPFAVVLTANEQRVALMVTRPLGQQEIVIKPLDDAGASEGPVSGATVRDDGGVSLIVDVGKVLRFGTIRAARVNAGG